MSILAGATLFVHLWLTLRTWGRDWTSPNLVFPAMFQRFSRLTPLYARVALGTGTVLAVLYAVGTLRLRLVKGW